MLPQCSILYADFQQLAVSCGFQCVRSEASEGESVCERQREKERRQRKNWSKSTWFDMKSSTKNLP